jgi:parallel beta-helix repeat protein
MNDTPLDRRFLLGGIAGAAGVSALAAMAKGGPLTPPAGAVASTAKPLAELEPRTAINAANTPGDADSMFRISQPGSYYLTGNITGVAGKHGIEIVASGVTLDLMGFELGGVAGSLSGVAVTVNDVTNITIRNGSVRNWRNEGVGFVTFAPSNSEFIDLRTSGNAGNGIATGTGCTVSSCTAYGNGGTGILATLGCTLTRCTASFNTLSGISSNLGCTITGCTAYSNAANGIVTSSGSTITGCTATGNAAHGILAVNACTITGCTAYLNAADGIAVAAACLVLSNTSTQNGTVAGGAGIHATGADNRIEGNTCSAADRGIAADTAGNFIVRNTCSGNTTNWFLAANNVTGPILDRTAPGSPAINGNFAPDSTGSTHPNANFSF